MPALVEGIHDLLMVDKAGRQAGFRNIKAKD